MYTEGPHHYGMLDLLPPRGVCVCTAVISSVPALPVWHYRPPPVRAAAFDDKPKRVGMIGSGWYGKTDLFRLLQVAPVEVVSLCDVDKMLAEAAEMVAQRQASKKKPRTFGDYRQMLREKDLDIVLDRDARSLARLAADCCGRSRGRCLLAKADQRGRGRGSGDARRRAKAQAGSSGWHAAPQHAALG